jgi:hypothetical protein
MLMLTAGSKVFGRNIIYQKHKETTHSIHNNQWAAYQNLVTSHDVRFQELKSLQSDFNKRFLTAS